MKKSTAYVVVESESVGGLVEGVTAKLAEGYEPIGGVATAELPRAHALTGSPQRPDVVYLQAMVRR